MRRLTAREETRILKCVQDRISFFSPTISPAPKDLGRREIESPFQALKYYFEKGVKRCILQPKYMGSYVDIYLHVDIEKTRFFSRNGYPISQRMISHEKLIEAVRPLHEKFLWWHEVGKGIELILIQAELLPWSALGKGLIEDDFGGYSICHQSHIDYLRDSSLRSTIGKLVDSPEFREYLKDVPILSKKELDQKYPHHLQKQFAALRMLQLPNPTSYQKALDLYNQQLQIYGQEGPLEFRPFNILKTVWNHDCCPAHRGQHREWYNPNNIQNFRQVRLGNDPYRIIELTQENLDAGFPEAYEYFQDLVGRQMEGMVVKPELVWNPELVPMFKVRNNNYLQMIYGIRFQDQYDDFMTRRKTGGKMRCSINEWNIGQSLLRIPMSQISPDNREYVELIEKRILEEEFEMTLDSRL